MGKNLLSQCFTLNIITQSLNGSGGVSLVNSGVCCYVSVLETTNRDGIEDLVFKFIELLYIYFSSNNKNTINTAVSHRVISQNLKNEKIDNIIKIRLCLSLEHLSNALFKNSVTWNLGVMNDLPDEKIIW